MNYVAWHVIELKVIINYLVVLYMIEQDKLLKEIYYNPKTTGSIRTIYNQVKNHGITYNDVKTYVQSQQTHQIFKKPKKPKHYFPHMADYKNQILQIDLANVSDIATVNKNYKYLLAIVDVFSRFAYVIPLKNKTTETVVDAIQQIIKETNPSIIISDNGSEFISSKYKELMKTSNIEVRYVQVNNHKGLAVVDSFIKTLRSKIAKYCEMHNTTTYINVLPDIVYNYNHSVNSGIQKIPAKVTKEDPDVFNLFMVKALKARAEEKLFNIGDQVRYIVNPKTFEKHSDMGKWTKTVHTIVDKAIHSYTLDNGHKAKYYELQLVHSLESLQKQQKTPSITVLKRAKKSERDFNKEGLNLDDITSVKKTRQQEETHKQSLKRIRKETDRLHY